MCGILGHFTFNGQLGQSQALRGQVNSLRHRGPDDGTWWEDGPFFFGHRRLSIIDLGHGRQPMATVDAQLVVAFNGEIYNYIELRKQLQDRGHVFRTESDTEVLLYGYREWGTGLPERLKGMFAFAIADRLRRQLFVARDRFGEKPLFYVEGPASMTFASEVRVLAALPFVPRNVNRRVLPLYLCLNYVPGNDTLMDGVHRVEPGTWRLYSQDGSVSSGRYWSPPDERLDDLREDDLLEQLDALLDGAVRLALRSDVPVGIFLSSGIDSSLVARSAVRSCQLSRAYCLAFQEDTYSEWEGARQTAAQIGIPITKIVMTAQALHQFIEIVDHADDPLADSSSLAYWQLSREASQSSKVVIGGDGGDELFGGYLTYQATLWHNRTTSRLPRPLRHQLARIADQLPINETKVSLTYKAMRFLRAAELPSNVAHFTWNGTWLPGAASALLEPSSFEATDMSLFDLARHHGLAERPSLAELQRLDIREYLPNDILVKSDRMSMAHGLEVRSPFLEPSLADFALGLPARFKVGLRGKSKRILRKLAGRKYRISSADMKKQGFSIPVHTWLRGPARELTLDLLSPSAVREFGFLNVREVQRVVDEHMSGRRAYGFELWGLMVLLAWYTQRIRQSPITPLDDPTLRRITLPAPSGFRPESM